MNPLYLAALLFAAPSLAGAATGAAAVQPDEEYQTPTQQARAWAACMWDKDPEAARKIADGKLSMYVDDSAMGPFWARVTCRVPKAVGVFPDNAQALRRLIIRSAPKAAPASGNVPGNI